MVRTKLAAWTACLLIACALPSAAGAASHGDEDGWKFGWSNGFKLDSPDGNFQLKFGGRLQADWMFVDQDVANESFYGDIPEANEFRRARLFFSGTIYKRVNFKVQYDFAGGDADFKDTYLEVTDTPVGNIRVGHFKEPFSLEELTSSKYIAFLERSLNNAFSPGRNTGIMFHDNAFDKRLYWAVGAFREADDFGETASASRGKKNFTGRVTGLPLYEDKGQRLVHVGASVTQKDLGVDPFRFRARPEVHAQSVRFVDTGDYMADDALIYGVEAAVVMNRFWAAAEYMMADSSSADFSPSPSFPTSDPSYSGHYVQAGFFLTDDYRRYKPSAGAFDRTKPSTNFGDDGWGAWEVAIRYSDLDLADALPNDPEGGELENVTLGLNWYLNPATRVMLNYIMSEPKILGVDPGSADYVTLRAQVDF